MSDTVQQLCFEGQNHLLATDYLAAEEVLVRAEGTALAEKDWDSLSRLYMPLQEVRRQRRQRCGEGTIKLDLIAHTAADVIDAEAIAKQYTHGQILVAGFGTIEPAVKLREIAHREKRYLDVLLGASYWVGGTVVVAIVPTDRVALPEDGEYSIDELTRRLPPHSVIIPLAELPSGERMGNTETFAQTMSLWERLHLPYLSLADATTDPVARIEAYRQTIKVDYACELAHQKLSDTARSILRTKQ